MRAGIPTAVAPAGTGLMTTAFAADLGAIAPTSNRPAPWHRRSCHHVLPAWGGALRLVVERGTAQGHALVDGAAIANFGVSPTTPMAWSMKTRSPILAPGWISMPVNQRAKCEMKRPSHFSPLPQRSCRPGAARRRCRPG